MKNVLINTTLSFSAIEKLEQKGLNVFNQNIIGKDCLSFLNENSIDTLLTSSDFLDDELLSAVHLKTIGICNDDSVVDYKAKYPKISFLTSDHSDARSIAELVIAHILSTSRFLFDANRQMPLEGDINFEQMQQAYALGNEIKGKTIGIIGDEPSGKEAAKLAISMGMDVLFCTSEDSKEINLDLEFPNNKTLNYTFTSSTFEEVCMKSDYISFHNSSNDFNYITKDEFGLLKMGVILINTCNSKCIDEVELLKAIDEGIVKHAALDCFENQPKPDIRLLMNPNIALSPSTSKYTKESKLRRGDDIVNKILIKLDKN